jgi:hypothetical protein
MKSVLIFLFCFFFATAQAQNLVPNPSFEQYDSCPDFASQISRATGWFSIRMTPDYLNTCAPYGWASIPSNYFGNTLPVSGNAYAGIGGYWFGGGGNYPECVGTQLVSPLSAGTKYFVSFKVFLAQYANSSQWCGINKLGALFSTTPYSYLNPAPLCNCAQVFSDSIIIDTLNWTRISGSFVADSNYSFMGIGRFFDDQSTSSIQLAGTQCNCFYFLDDVCVSTDSLTCFANALAVESISPTRVINLFPNPSSTTITISLPSYQNAMLSIFNLLGEKVKEEKVTGNQVTMDISSLPEGLYLVGMENEMVGKFVKE